MAVKTERETRLSARKGGRKVILFLSGIILPKTLLKVRAILFLKAFLKSIHVIINHSCFPAYITGTDNVNVFNLAFYEYFDLPEMAGDLNKIFENIWGADFLPSSQQK